MGPNKGLFLWLLARALHRYSIEILLFLILVSLWV